VSERGTRPATWYRWQDLPREELHERLSRRLITGDRVMLAHVYLKKGCVVPKHSHENEQFTYILEGALRFLVGETGAEEIVVRAGEVLHLPSHLPHEAHALRIRSTWMCSIRHARIGSTRRTRTCGGRKRVLLLLSYSPAARRVILSERAERARREGSVGAYEKRILRACGAQDDRPLASRKRRKRG